MSMPGGFASDPDIEGVDEVDDSDFSPSNAQMDGADDSAVDEEEEGEDEEGEEEEEEERTREVAGLSLGVNRSTGRIVLVRDNGTAVQLDNNLLYRLARQGLLATIAGGAAGGDDEEEPTEDDDDDDDDGGQGGTDDEVMFRPGRRGAKPCYPIQKEPAESGVQILRSGEFGRPPLHLLEKDRRYRSQIPERTKLHDVCRLAEYSRKPFDRNALREMNVPNHNGTEVATFDSRIYTGQYSSDGSFFYTCSQNFRAYIYDMTIPLKVHKSDVHDSSEPLEHSHRPEDQEQDVMLQWGRRRGGRDSRQRSSLHLARMFQARERNCRWTITDASLSPSNSHMVYSSISTIVHLVKTRGENAVLGLGLEEHEQEELDFSNGRDDFGVWSLKFGGDGRELAAGCSRGILVVADVEQKRPVCTVRGHSDDVNAVCFADQYNPNMIVSGSDDSLLKLWDRRDLRASRPAGVMVGHTEGVTYVEGKGDGLYILSNGKDQGVKLWDLRRIRSWGEYTALERIDAGIDGFDYRWSHYTRPKFQKHPQDGSVMTYRGHSVLHTLIRAHFSPPGATQQQYIYSGSADGKIRIWHLDGRTAQVLDRSASRPLLLNSSEADAPEYADPMMPDSLARASGPRRSRLRMWDDEDAVTVRDVSWHPSEPTLISTSWGGSRNSRGSLAMHHYFAEGKRSEAVDFGAMTS